MAGLVPAVSFVGRWSPDFASLHPGATCSRGEIGDNSAEGGNGLPLACGFSPRPAMNPPPPSASVPPMDAARTYPPEDAAGPPPEPAARPSPMIEQYIEIKAANPDCLLFYRMGDFYELFFEDAEIASRALGIVLTKRGKHLGRDIPMCGVPVIRSDEYLHRLIAQGHRVAVCEQTEDPAEAKKRGSKSVVRRDVVRLVTPGTLTEDNLLEPGRANYLLAIARRRASDTQWCYGLAAV